MTISSRIQRLERQRAMLHARTQVVLATARNHRGLSYRQAADEIGCGVATIHRVEHGTHFPQTEVLTRLATWAEANTPASRTNLLTTEVNQ